MPLEVKDPALAMEQVVGRSTVILTCPGPARPLEHEAKPHPDTVEEPGARLGAPIRDQTLLGVFALSRVDRCRLRLRALGSNGSALVKRAQTTSVST